RHMQQARLAALGLRTPVLEIADGADALGNARRVEFDLALLAGKDVPPPDLGFQPLDPGAQAAVGLEKFSAHEPLAGFPCGTDQRLPDEDPARLLGRHRTIVDTSSRGERKAV